MLRNLDAPGLALLLLAPFSAHASDCAIATFEQTAAKSPYGVTLTSAEDSHGDFCQVEGEIANASDGKSQIKFRLRFPSEGAWNSKFMVLGNGGTAGTFQSEDRVLTSLGLGYVTGQTDTGHSGRAMDWMMKEIEPGVVVPNNVTIDDFAHRSIHLTTVIGKQFVEAFYARDPEYSYYFGCSTGGRQGLKAMQRYPNDFDGVVAGAPVYSLTRLNMSQLWTAQQSAKLEAKNEPFSAEQLKMLKDAVLNSCDSLDGLKDRLLDDPRKCDFDPAELQCEGSSQSPPQCLTDSQVEFVRAVYRGPVTKAGERIYPGRPRGGEGAGRGGWGFLGPGCQRCGIMTHGWYQDPEMDLLGRFSIDNPDDVAAADASYYSAATRADNPDVTPFVQSGGKAILYHGWTDTNVTPIPTVELYAAMEDTVSRKRGTSDFRDHIRLFMAPGMGHCGGGDGPNNYAKSALEAIDAWVAEGKAPDSIVATHERRGMSRPWCPYPQVARLKAPNLDSNKAENFQCVSPTD